MIKIDYRKIESISCDADWGYEVIINNNGEVTEKWFYTKDEALEYKKLITESIINTSIN